MSEDLLIYLKTIYKNAVAVTNYENRPFSISVDFKFRWIDLKNRTSYYDRHCTISTKEFNDFMEKQNGL